MGVVDMSLEELKKYRGSSPKATDFDEFWEKALEELDTVQPDVELKTADFSCRGAECFDLYFDGVRGARIHAKYLRPKTITGPRPCVLVFHGYTMDSSDWCEKLPYVLEGMCVAALDCRGQGGQSEDSGSYPGYTLRGHVTRGLAGDPQDMLYRHIFLDTVELARIVSGFPEVDEERLGTLGGSQGGALSVACSALYGNIKRSVIGYPFLSDFRRSGEMGLFVEMGNPCMEIGEFFQRFDPKHLREQEIFEKLSYIDVHNHAPNVKNPAFVTTGLQDNICLPSTQFAVYNCLGGEKTLSLYPELGHGPLPYWQDEAFEFLKNL